MNCPKCNGFMAPDRSYDVPAEHCMNCGFLVLGERQVAMPEIPPVRQLSTNPNAVAARDWYQRVKVNGGPLRQPKQEVNHV